MFWIACYLLLALGPLAAILLVEDLPPRRGFWVEFAAALGFIALAMFALQFVLTARFRHIASPHGLDTVLQFHREAGIVAVVFAVLHPVILIAVDRSYLAFFNAPLIAAMVAMVLIIALTLKRQAFRIPYEWWRLSHGLLGVLIVVVALTHILQMQWYLTAAWQRRLWTGLTVAALLLLAHVRVGKPIGMLLRAYRVREVRPEGMKTWTIALEPVGHANLRFKPGQFAWLTLGDNAFALEQHPFSISSSALRTDRIEFTVRELGDFTSTIGGVKPGTKAFIEGPYGAFVPDFKKSSGLVLIAGGVGIAPMMSILRTTNERRDPRIVHLIYGVHSSDDATFRAELGTLNQTMNLRVTCVVEEEAGPIRGEVLARHLPLNRETFDYFVCGPAPMMDVVERYLIGAGVPPMQIHSERFDIA